jgi:hypothetical protein
MAIGLGANTRRALLDRYSRSHPQWTANEVSTNVAGYVARAREWGLVEPHQLGGTYALTEHGKTKIDYRTKGVPC